jgi:hypothetical protein
MRVQCPSRSGDKKPIYWMVLERLDFYFDVYRSESGQLEILEIALDEDAGLKARLMAITEGEAKAKNQCERNWALLLGQTRD